METDDLDQSRAAAIAYRVAVPSAVVAGLFSALVCALLLWDYSRRSPDDPLESPSYQELKAQLSQSPDDEGLKQRIRRLDWRLRQEYFGHRAFSAFGAWLLLGGAVCCLIAAKAAATLRRRLPDPGPATTPQDFETRWTRVARWSVAALTAVLVAVALGLGTAAQTPLPRSEAELAGLAKPAAAVGPAYPTAEQLRRSWPRFRGPQGAGISAYDNVPTAWHEATGKGIVWKTEVPLPGKNSPVVWGDRVVLSGATEELRQVYCFETGSGKLLWRRDARGTPQSTHTPPKVSQDTGYAAPTVTTDGRRVFAMFANGDVVAFDFSGNPAWSRSLGIPDNTYGHAASLTMFQDLLLIQFDQGSRKDDKSKLLALEGATGKTAWETPRKVPNSWGSPIVIRHQGRDQVVTCADPWVIAYRPQDGQELWRVKCLTGDCGVSPVFADGAVHAGNEYCTWFAIRADGKGDVTETHVLWTAEDGLPDVCSPLVTDDYLFLLASFGSLTCYDVTDGEMLWYEDFDASFVSSPSMAGRRVYLFGQVQKEEEDEEGLPLLACKTWVLQPGREACKTVGECYLDEDCVTSPAFQDGRIYIRGEKHLYCLGEK